jgi:ketosteroid isomerase-like protein
VSEQNVEIVRRFAWAFENDTETFRELIHPEIEWMPFEDNNTPSHGLDGALAIRNAWLDAWDEHRIDIQEIFDAGGEDVFSGVALIGRGKASGVGVDVQLYVHFKVVHGKVIYMYEYADRAEALKAVGLEE